MIHAATWTRTAILTFRSVPFGEVATRADAQPPSRCELCERRSGQVTLKGAYIRSPNLNQHDHSVVKTGKVDDTGVMTSHIVPSPEKIPTLSEAASISPILLRLLECPTPLLSTLSNQVLDSLKELPDDDRPTSYEGLIDVARFCVEEEPGWNELERARLLEGHPRIGRQKAAISAVSAQEQGGQSDTDEATYNRE